jgi:hypothetical protein
LTKELPIKFTSVPAATRPRTIVRLSTVYVVQLNMAYAPTNAERFIGFLGGTLGLEYPFMPGQSLNG